MLLQQMQPPPPALSGEMSGKSEGAYSRADKSVVVISTPAWLPQLLPLGQPQHVCVHSCMHQPVLHTHAHVSVCVKSFFLSQTEQKSAVARTEENVRLVFC